jgi:hypothetical protein
MKSLSTSLTIIAFSLLLLSCNSSNPSSETIGTSANNSETKHFTYPCEKSQDKSCLSYSFDYPSSWGNAGRTLSGTVTVGLTGNEITFWGKEMVISEQFALETATTVAKNNGYQEVSRGNVCIGSYCGSEVRLRKGSIESPQSLERLIWLPRSGNGLLIKMVVTSDSSNLTNFNALENSGIFSPILSSLKIS